MSDEARVGNQVQIADLFRIIGRLTVENAILRGEITTVPVELMPVAPAANGQPSHGERSELDEYARRLGAANG